MGIKMDDEERRWCDLPKLLLWMVMDRQHYVDRERVGFVCRDWKSAHQSYPSPSPSPSPCGSISPWVIHRPVGNYLVTIFNPITMENFTIGLPALYDGSHILFSKNGWVLFQGMSEDHLFPVILFNIPTGAKITFPSPHHTISYDLPNSPLSPDLVPGSTASFSTYDDGTPRTVVFAFGATRNFYIGDVRTRTWKTHYVGGGSNTGIFNLLVVGNKLYALDSPGTLLIYDFLTHLWTEVAADHPHVPLYESMRGLAQSQNGDILKIEPAHMSNPVFHISKLNATQTGWDQILPHHPPSIFNSWYLSRYGNHFVTTNQPQQQQQEATADGGGIKIYHIEIPFGNKNTDATVIVHDFKNSTARPITETPPLALRPKWYQVRWIDLGSMEKVPPSCLRYDQGSR